MTTTRRPITRKPPKPTRHAAPFTAISRHARGQLFLIATPLGDRWSYRIDYPYYSWAETIVRPRIERHDFSPLIARLNEAEKRKVETQGRSTTGRWTRDDGELTSAIKYTDPGGMLCASSLLPEEVAEEVSAAIEREKEISVAGS